MKWLHINVTVLRPQHTRTALALTLSLNSRCSKVLGVTTQSCNFISFVAAPCCTAPLPKNQAVLTSALQKLLMQFPHLQRDYIFCWTCMRHAGQLSSHVPQVGRILSMDMLQQKSATILSPAIHYFLPHTARDENQGITAQIITLCTGGHGTTQ